MGKNTFRLEVAGITKTTALEVLNPTIDNGFWLDPSTGGTIKEIYYGSKVKFIVETSDIPDGTTLNFILFDYDSKYNPDDELERSFSAVTKGNMAELEFMPNVKWKKSAKYEIDMVVEVYFRIETEINNQKIVAELPKQEDDYLTLYDKEVKITLLVELPHSLETGWGAKGLAGHTAMAIGDQYFDYGPDYNVTMADEKKYDYDFNDDGDKKDIVDLSKYDVGFKFAPGRPWWGEMVAKINGINAGDVKLSQVLTFILPHWSNNNVYGEVNKIEFYVNQEQADQMLDWWDTRYKHLKLYSVYPWSGEQCTTTVKTALQTGGINIPDETQKPIGILNDFKNLVLSTSTKHYREKPDIKVIKPESSDWKP